MGCADPKPFSNMYDRITSCRINSPCNRLERLSLMGFWSNFCLVLLIWSSTPFCVKAETINYYRPSASYAYTAVRNIYITNNRSTAIRVIPSSGTTQDISAGQTKLFNVSTTLTLSGLSSTNTPVNGSGSMPSRTYTYSSIGGPQLGSKTVSAFSFDAAANYSTSTPYVSNHDFPAASFTVNPDGTTTPTIDPFPDSQVPDPDPFPAREEIMLALQNDTGVVQQIMWGDKLLTLQPGMNQIRYDGPINTLSGLPSVTPSDFVGRNIPAGDLGQQRQVMGFLGFHPSGEGVSWKTPPLFIPKGGTPPASPASWIETITKASSTNGGTIIIHAPDGSRTITTFPLSHPPSSASNTSGGGAVLSNPTTAPPPQTTTNTTNNVAGNTTSTVNNTTINNTTIINGDGTSQSNAGQMDAVGFNGSLVPDSEGSPGDDLKNEVGSVKTAFLGKLQNYHILQTGTIPKAEAYHINIVLPGLCTINQTIDFTAVPFPQVRFAILIMMTVAFGVAFLKRITI